MLATAMMAAAMGASGPAALLEGYRAAWDRSDARTLAGFYAPDGQLHTPYGAHAEGRAAVEAFYAAAFQRGYASSRGLADLERTTPLGRDLVLVRGRWGIDGARTETGAARPPERGEFVAVMRREPRGGGWRILVLDEMAGAAPPTP